MHDRVTHQKYSASGQQPLAKPRLVRLRLVATSLGVSVETVRRRIADGSLPAHRVMGRLYVKPEDLAAFIERHREIDVG